MLYHVPKQECRNSLLNNNSSKSALSRRLATLKTFSTVTVHFLVVVLQLFIIVVLVLRTWLLDFAPGARLPEFAGLFSVVCSAKLSDVRL